MFDIPFAIIFCIGERKTYFQFFFNVGTAIFDKIIK
jgi:hypothetical protein